MLALAVTVEGLHEAAWAVGGGACGALALHLSYGTVVMLLPAAFVVLGARRRPVAGSRSLGAAAITGVFVVLGFWWFDGLAATRIEYRAGAGGVRPYWYFATLGNPAALLVALGPAVPVAVARLRDAQGVARCGRRRGRRLLADLSGLSKAEVERIWLPFVPWLAVAPPSSSPSEPPAGGWLRRSPRPSSCRLALESPW